MTQDTFEAEARSENEDRYDAFVEGDEDILRGAILNDPLRVIGPTEPICVTPDVSVRHAIDKLKEHPKHHGAVCVVDGAGRLIGIFSERDVVNRVVGAGRDASTTTIGEVMTKEPLALPPDAKIAEALHYMSVRGFRNIPIVQDGKPIGIVFTRHFVKFIVSLFPERTLNLREGGVKNPEAIYGG